MVLGIYGFKRALPLYFWSSVSWCCALGILQAFFGQKVSCPFHAEATLREAYFMQQLTLLETGRLQVVAGHCESHHHSKSPRVLDI